MSDGQIESQTYRDMNKQRDRQGKGQELGGFQLLPPQGKMKVLDRPVATEQARTGYIFRDKSEITTSLPQASKDKKNKGLYGTENNKRIYCWEKSSEEHPRNGMMTRAFQSDFVP
ncbi:hypothetical protein PoB_006022700 [Plakobranchus ocellatus]|uniref:Uncharacterized protein n=1 Tax=Plakobranchus ocellatus TaxID=259542 RepID=A0AAV4CPA4_9GAST|nr:hypothetical protein PoB_006022700 [Plakobranchus ocellatus]